MEREVLILGGGPAGMAAAFELNKAGKSFVVVEKNEEVGGLSRTLVFGEFRTDTGPHRFFSQNKYLYDFIEDLLGESWIKVDRLTRFYVNGKFFLYPVELRNALLNVGFYKGFKIVRDYLFERTKKVFLRKEPISFEEQVISDFGRTLAELNMLNYTEKIWGLPCAKISPDWARQRIRGLSLKEMFKKAIIKSKEGPKTLVDQFYYPASGTGLIYQKIKERILDGRYGIVKLNSRPVKIGVKNNKIEEIIVKTNKGNEIFRADYVLSSIPITEFINLLDTDVPKDVLKAAQNLRFRSHVSLFITLNKSSVFPDQWIYFPEKEIPFGRIMEPKNFSKKMSPPDKTSLLLEFFCWENEEVWEATKEKLFNLSLEWLEDLGFVKEKEVLGLFVHKERYAYPVYDLGYRENLDKVKNYLGQIKNLQLIGRAGSFRYNNQDHALEMGILAARNVIEGKKYNIDEIGTEQEYFERGYVK
ncbi:MAG: FAD-dependent oxidoreductase [candidate division WOR-3 bacterium]